MARLAGEGGARSYGALFPGVCDSILEGIEHGVPVDYEGDREPATLRPQSAHPTPSTCPR